MLGELSAAKCWYCEQREIRSDNPVDHFRPKGAVAEAASHEGYWWLSFVWDNYRYSCTFCNSKRVDQATGISGGKADHFPLVSESQRAHTPVDDLDAELPLLLDPTNATDPTFLFFDDQGKAVPHPRTSGAGTVAEARAKRSIELYNLNHTGIEEQRRRLNSQLRRWFAAAARNITLNDAGDAVAQANYRDAFTSLVERMSPRSELSATTRSFLLGRRGDGPHAEAVLERLGILI